MAMKKRKITGRTTLDCGCELTVHRVFRGNGAEARRVERVLAHAMRRKVEAHVCPPKPAPEPATDEANPT